MGGNVLKKLRSSKGASITFALLAFLVCAMVSAVLLAAASASSGRLSDIAQMDQRYYAVTSAAQLFCESMDGTGYSIERSWEHKTSSSRTYALRDGKMVPDGPYSNPTPVPPETYTLKIKTANTIDDEIVWSPWKTETSSPKGTSILSDAALWYVFGSKYDEAPTVMAANSFQYSEGVTPYRPGSIGSEWDYKAEFTGYSFLDVDIKLELKQNGNIIITFTNHQEDSANPVDPFSVVVTMKASIEDNFDSPNVSEISRVKNGTFLTDDNGVLQSYTEELTTDKTETKTTTITWQVSDVRKG